MHSNGPMRVAHQSVINLLDNYTYLVG